VVGMKFLTEEMRKSGFSGLEEWREDETEVEVDEEKDFERERMHQKKAHFLLWKDFQDEET